MNKSFFLKLLVIILIILVIVLSYLVLVFKNETSENKMSNTETFESEDILNNDTSATDEVVDVSDDIIYVGMYNCFLGSFEQGKWYNAQYGFESNLLLDKDFNENEIQNGSEYYLHEQNKKVESLGTEIISVTDDYEYIVDENGMIVDSHFRLESNLQETSAIQIVTNKKESIFPVKMGEATASQDMIKIINKAKSDLYLDTIETEIVKIVVADIDFDGKDESFVLIETKHDKNGYALADNGACVIVLMIDENDYKVIYKDNVYKEEATGINTEMYLTDLTITDINYNGKLEVCIAGGVWDIPIYSIHEYDEITENFETVLYGEFAW